MEYFKKLSLIEWIDPWIDKNELNVGDSWQYEIDKNLRNSDVYLLIFSKHGINKIEYFQKEVNYAIGLLEYHPYGRTVVIPVKIDDCSIPPFIAEKVQCIDAKNTGESWSSIYKALEKARQEHDIELTSGIILPPFNIVKVEKEMRINVGVFPSYLQFAYPHFSSNTRQDIVDQLNALVFTRHTEILMGYTGYSPWEEIKTEVVENREALGNRYNEYGETYKIFVVKERFISIEFQTWGYFSQAAHYYGGYNTLNFIFGEYLHRLSLSDFFPEDKWSLALSRISAYCIASLKLKLLTNPAEKDEWIEKGAGENIHNFETFSITENAFRFLFGDYRVGCYAQGPQEVEMPLEKLYDLLKAPFGVQLNS